MACLGRLAFLACASAFSTTYWYSGCCAAFRIRLGLVVASCGAYCLSVAKSPVSATILLKRLSSASWAKAVETRRRDAGAPRRKRLSPRSWDAAFPAFWPNGTEVASQFNRNTQRKEEFEPVLTRSSMHLMRERQSRREGPHER